MDTEKIPKNFIDWACSLSGCDGGNINAETWVCGIEWGNTEGNSEYYYKELPKEIQKGETTPTYDRFPWDDSLTYPFGRSFAKLYAAIRGEEDVQNYKKLVEEQWDGSELFKLNLYPISFRSTDESLWEKYNLHELTGFDEKYLFQTWCFLKRFPEFSKIRAEKKPKLIIGTGNGYLRDFLMCFAWGQDISNFIRGGKLKSNSKANDKERIYYWVKYDDTTLFVVPFFSGPYGLNSDYLLQKMGEKIGEEVNVK